MATKQEAATGTPKGRMSLVVPDGAIRAYFAVFPLIVAGFLSVQAVRAHGMEAMSHVPAQTAATMAP